jgi:hypothetical protein
MSPEARHCHGADISLDPVTYHDFLDVGFKLRLL